MNSCILESGVTELQVALRTGHRSAESLKKYHKQSESMKKAQISILLECIDHTSLINSTLPFSENKESIEACNVSKQASIFINSLVYPSRYRKKRKLRVIFSEVFKNQINIMCQQNNILIQDHKLLNR